MRRLILLIMGTLELLVGLVILILAWLLPASGAVQDGMETIGRLGQQTGQQVESLRLHLQHLRERKPLVKDFAIKLDTQWEQLIDMARNQGNQLDKIRSIDVALEESTRALSNLEKALQLDDLSNVGTSLKETADYLDDKFSPSLRLTADNIEKSTQALKEEFQYLATLLRSLPVDLQTLKAIHEGLGRFNMGIGQTRKILELKNLGLLQEGMQALDESLLTASKQVEKIGTYTYPTLRFEGLNSTVEAKPIWPEAGQVAEGLKKAAEGSRVVAKDVGKMLSEHLPAVRSSLDEAHKILEQSHLVLGKALKNQDQVDALLKRVPEQAALLADRLPGMASSLAKALRDTAHLDKLANALRKAKELLDLCSLRLPDIRRSMKSTLEVLQAIHKGFRLTLENPVQFREGLERTLNIAQSFSRSLPLFLGQLEQDLQQQEESLVHLEKGIDDVARLLPEASLWAVRMIQFTRLLLTLGAIIFGLHGIYLIFGFRQV